MNHGEKRVALDLILILRTIPWMLLKQGAEPIPMVRRALNDYRTSLEVGIDAQKRKMLMKMILRDWTIAMGMRELPSEFVEIMINEVMSQVDEYINEKYDDGLGSLEKT